MKADPCACATTGIYTGQGVSTVVSSHSIHRRALLVASHLSGTLARRIMMTLMYVILV